jgi:hypothetical protein
MSLAVLVFPIASLQPALNINLLAFTENLIANLGQITPGYNIKPFGFLTAFAVGSRPCSAGCQAK